MGTTQTGFLPALELGYETACEYAAQFGLDYIEIYTEGEPWRPGLLSAPDKIQQQLQQYGLGLTAHLTFPIDIGSPMDPVEKRLLRASRHTSKRLPLVVESQACPVTGGTEKPLSLL